MEYKIIFYKERLIEKDIAKIPQKNISHIFDTLDFFAKNGLPNMAVKKLNNYKLAGYRLRVGSYRILFDINDRDKKIIVFRILHRSKFY